MITVVSNEASWIPRHSLIIAAEVGNLAHRDPLQQTRVEDIAASGEGLAFIAFAESLTTFGEDWVCLAQVCTWTTTSPTP
eukprot:207415-Amphidinium_carterae.1